MEPGEDQVRKKKKTSTKKKAKQEPSREFSRLRCLFSPQSAANPECSAPFAILEVFIHKARALLPADIDGLSDPYVRLDVNGKSTGKQTTPRSKTLAPQWEEGFEVEIFRPMSVLTLSLYDSDFGSSTDVGVAGQLFGLDDDFIGYLDVQIARLPHNEAVSAWFNVLSPDSYVDSIKGRLLKEVRNKSQEPDEIAGQIKLQLKLKVNQPSDEFFAFCIGPAPFGMHLEPLDLPALFADGLHLTEHADAWELRGEALVDDAKKQSTLLFSVAIFIVWNPMFLLPAVVLAVIAFLALQHRWEPHYHPKGIGNQADVKAAVEALAADTGATPDVVEGESLIDPVLLKTLGSAQGMVSPEDAANLRLAFRNIHLGLGAIRAFEKAMHNGKQATLLMALLGAVSAFIIAFREWQAIVIQVSLTCVFMVFLIQHSFITRIAWGFVEYHIHKRQLRIHSKDSMSKKQRRALQKADSRSLSRMESKHLQTLAHSKHHKSKEEGSMQKHNFEVTTFPNLTWCDDCGKFLWGVYQQGLRCTVCRRHICVICNEEEQTHEGCVGQPIKRRGCCMAPCRAPCCPRMVKEAAGAGTPEAADIKLKEFPQPPKNR